MVAVDGIVRGKKVGALGACEPEVTLVAGTHIDLSPTEAPLSVTQGTPSGRTATLGYCPSVLETILPPVLDLPYAALQPDYATAGNGRENDMLHLSVFVVA